MICLLYINYLKLSQHKLLVNMNHLKLSALAAGLVAPLFAPPPSQQRSDAAASARYFLASN